MKPQTELLEYLKAGLGEAMDSLIELSAIYQDDDFDDRLLPSLDLLTDLHWFTIECENSAAGMDRVGEFN